MAWRSAVIVLVAWVATALPMHEGPQDVTTLMEVEEGVRSLFSPLSQTDQGVEDNLRINRWRQRIARLKAQAKLDQQGVLTAALAIPGQPDQELGESLKSEAQAPTVEEKPQSEINAEAAANTAARRYGTKVVSSTPQARVANHRAAVAHVQDVVNGINEAQQEAVKLHNSVQTGVALAMAAARKAEEKQKARANAQAAEDARLKAALGQRDGQSSVQSPAQTEPVVTAQQKPAAPAQKKPAAVPAAQPPAVEAKPAAETKPAAVDEPKQTSAAPQKLPEAAATESDPTLAAKPGAERQAEAAVTESDPTLAADPAAVKTSADAQPAAVNTPAKAKPAAVKTEKSAVVETPVEAAAAEKTPAKAKPETVKTPAKAKRAAQKTPAKAEPGTVKTPANAKPTAEKTPPKTKPATVKTAKPAAQKTPADAKPAAEKNPAEAPGKKPEAKKPVAPKSAKKSTAAAAKSKPPDNALKQRVTSVSGKMQALLKRVMNRHEAEREGNQQILDRVKSVEKRLTKLLPATLAVENLVEESESTLYSPTLSEGEAAAAQQSAAENSAALQEQAYEAERETAEVERQEQQGAMSVEQQQAEGIARRKQMERAALQKEMSRLQSKFRQKVKAVKKQEKEKAINALKEYATRVQEQEVESSTELGSSIGAAQDKIFMKKATPSKSKAPLSGRDAPNKTPARSKVSMEQPKKANVQQPKPAKKHKQASKEQPKSAKKHEHASVKKPSKKVEEKSKVEQEHEAEVLDQKEQQEAIMEAGVQRALVDTAKEIHVMKKKTSTALNQMKAMWKTEEPREVKAAVAKARKEFKTAETAKKEQSAAKDLKSETARFASTQKMEKEVSTVMQNLSQLAGKEMSAIKKTMSLGQRLTDVAHDVESKVTQTELGESSTNGDGKGVLQSLAAAAQEETSTDAKVLKLEGAIKADFAEVVKLLQGRPSSDKPQDKVEVFLKAPTKPQNQSEDLLLIDETAPVKAAKHQPMPRLSKERQALVKAEVKLSTLKKHNLHVLSKEGKKLRQDSKDAIAAAKLKVKQEADKENKKLDRDIRDTTQVDMKIGRETETVKQALDRLANIRKNMSKMVNLQSRAGEVMAQRYGQIAHENREQ